MKWDGDEDGDGDRDRDLTGIGVVGIGGMRKSIQRSMGLADAS